MAPFQRTVDLPVPAADAIAWHERPAAARRLVPPWGAPDLRRHERRIVETSPTTSRLEDTVADGASDERLERAFRYRHRVTAADLRQHHAYRDRPRITVAITGATGLVGSALVDFLEAGGHTVRHVVRQSPKPGDVLWDPAGGTIDADALAGCDAVVHLAGENIAGRWTPERKDAILRSRVDGTALLARTLAALPADRRPATLVSGSAVGFYGSRGDEILTEASAGGDGFLADVCRAWEAAADPARDAGIRVAHPRIGIVMSGRGGALPPQVTPAKLGLGGPIGGGRQWISWVAHDDLVAILGALALDDRYVGPVNATAPAPATQGELARDLGAVLHRPAFLPLPAAVIRIAGGEAGESMLLDGQRVLPARLQEAGFRHEHRELADALRHELGK